MAAQFDELRLMEATWPGLANLTQSIFSGLGGQGFRNAFHLDRSPATCLLLLDGLGWNLLKAHARHAPFLASLMQPDAHFKVGFPATTASSLATISSGMGSGAHGIVGCSFALDEHTELSPLTWTCAPLQPASEAGPVPDPESFIVPQTAWAQAREQGIAISTVMLARYATSDFTKAIYRASRILPAPAYEAYPALVNDALNVEGPAFCFAYFGDLDFAGHLFGAGSPAWVKQLEIADQLARSIAGQLPASATLMVIADHGMRDLDRDAVRDFDTEPALQQGVQAIAGDIRARYLYTEAGQQDRVHERWQNRLGDDYRVLSKTQAIAGGLFGDVILSQAESRIGQLIVMPTGGGGIIRSEGEKHASHWRGHHGALTDDDQVVPLLMCSGLARR
ncbi:alkaline phosphatase family protein [Pseudomonas fontis]|uniref:Alkaline phosphatase family protein n=1 Tax=Pseudomonas fontis TaxID=2942633 RepID=A0ABT5NTM6_9PSED|nr:alkaline phosphatase family protein [Pseudomonas fontis]MDD0976073.1 alkaline phosphatase family protein [Pseudomonas fontis]MDD0991523.1 alkaline phosphatase family protein [Pseudomonas fontis]